MDDRGRIRLSIKALLEDEAKAARDTADSFGLKTSQ
jgi:polyribonucleotide nucleotidyltransferase